VLFLQVALEQQSAGKTQYLGEASELEAAQWFSLQPAISSSN